MHKQLSSPQNSRGFTAANATNCALHAAKSCAAEKSDRRVWASGDLGGLTPAVLGWTGVALAAMAIAAVAIYVDYEIESRNGPKPMIVARPAPAVPPEDAAVEVQPDAPAAVADATAAETTTTTTRQTLLTRVGQNVAEFASPASEPLLEELAGTRDQLSAMGQSLLAPFPSYLFTTPPDETSDAQPPT